MTSAIPRTRSSRVVFPAGATRMQGILRPATERDAEQIAAIYAPFVRDTPTSFELEPPDAAEMERRIRETVRTHPWLVCEREGEVLGYVYATPFRARPAYQWGTETTVYIKEGRRRSGLGRALYRALFSVLELQGFRMAYAAIALPNLPSVRLHEALGFEPIGVFRNAGFKLGGWHDVGWWQRSLLPADLPEAPPTPFAEIQSTSAFLEALASVQASTTQISS